MVASRNQNENSETFFRRRPALAVVVLVLLGAAAASNVYLTDLFARVQQAGSADVASFCNVSDAVHCSRVAASRYATLGGVPLSLFAAEYFGFVTLGVLLTQLRLWSIRNWESLLFWTMLLAFPVCAFMAYIALFKMRILCPMCSVTYGANAVVLALLVLFNRMRLRALMVDGPRELGALFCTRRAAQLGMLAIFAVGFSQFAWVPGLLGAPAGNQNRAHAAASKAHLPKGGMEVGPRDAPIQLIEFSDYQCSVCRAGHDRVVELLRRYPGKIHFTHKDFPLDDACNRVVTRRFHPHACQAAFYARCAARQGKYWPYSAVLFSNQPDQSRKQLETHARKLKLDLNALRRCASEAQTRRGVLNDIEDGIRREVKGTPTFFLNGEQVVGPRDMVWWETRLKRLLSDKPKRK